MKVWLLMLFAAGAALVCQDQPPGCTLITVAGRDSGAPALPAPAVRFAPDQGSAMAVLPGGQLVFVWHNGVLRLDPPMVSSWTDTPPNSNPYGYATIITALLPASDTAILLIDGQRIKRLHTDGTLD